MNKIKGVFVWTAFAFALVAMVAVSGCTSVGRGMGTLTANKNAKPRSGSVWVVPPPQLEPPSVEEQVAYISYRNISDADIDLGDVIKQAAVSQGWKVTNNPREASYRLRASLRYFGEVEPESGGAYKAAALGAVSGAALGVGAGMAAYELSDGNLATTAGVGIAGAIAGAGISNAMQLREWALILDVVLEEKMDAPVTFEMAKSDSSSMADSSGTGNSRMVSGGGTAGQNTTSASASKTSDYYPHGVRLSVWANQMNMTEEEAMPLIMERAERVVKQMLPM